MLEIILFVEYIRATMNHVHVISALGDNYIYLLTNPEHTAIVIDPSDASVVLSQIQKKDLKLSAVLATHHHSDHTAGIRELIRRTNCEVFLARELKDGQMLTFGDCHINVIATPGHTADSVCFYIEPANDMPGMAFTGDTLFIGGCGRPMECDARTMFESLQKLAALPDDILVYPGHDYTEENYEFALTIKPDNEMFQNRLEEIRNKQRQGKPTVPSTIAQEKQTNIFLLAENAQIFAKLRKRKNIFG